MRFFFCITILALAASGCVTKSQADARARSAYLAGQQAAYKSMGAQLNVVVLGDVQKHEVPYVDGLTLGQAIATANYTGLHDPKLILVKRGDQQTPVDPKKLLSGEEITLQAGDVITVIGQ
ncbi:MAG TPA: hypothetical protein VMO20_02880 [Candidatus Acidoferrum sp.]|nr:hypothetical protein [Candidatus Acidoferrum sp.]